MGVKNKSKSRCKYSQELVDRAKHLYTAGGWTKAEIAREIKVPQGTVSDWLNGRRRERLSLNELRMLEEERQGAELERVEQKALELARTQYPAGAESYSCGLFYKRGLHGKVFYYDGEEWRKSVLKPTDITWSFRGLR